jgi:hypothetical protein
MYFSAAASSENDLPLYRGISARQGAKAAQNLANHGGSYTDDEEVLFEAARRVAHSKKIFWELK